MKRDLRKTEIELESLRQRYFELYDLAPKVNFIKSLTA